MTRVLVGAAGLVAVAVAGCAPPPPLAPALVLPPRVGRPAAVPPALLNPFPRPPAGPPRRVRPRPRVAAPAPLPYLPRLVFVGAARGAPPVQVLPLSGWGCGGH
jgi:hypothetical protein